MILNELKSYLISFTTFVVVLITFSMAGAAMYNIYTYHTIMTLGALIVSSIILVIGLLLGFFTVKYIRPWLQSLLKYEAKPKKTKGKPKLY